MSSAAPGFTLVTKVPTCAQETGYVEFRLPGK